MRAYAIAMLAIAFVYLLPTGASAAAPVPPECDQGVDVTIDGTLHNHKEYGAPGWGEDPAHDEPWTMTSLDPAGDSKAVVAAFFKRCGENEAAADSVQLLFDKGPRRSVRDGDKAVVKGKLRLPSGAPDEIRLGLVEVSTISTR